MTVQRRPFGRMGRLTEEKVPVKHATAGQLRIVKVFPATGMKPLISDTFSVPLIEAVTSPEVMI